MLEFLMMGLGLAQSRLPISFILSYSNAPPELPWPPEPPWLPEPP
jgi:hypothetical protein